MKTPDERLAAWHAALIEWGDVELFEWDSVHGFPRRIHISGIELMGTWPQKPSMYNMNAGNAAVALTDQNAGDLNGFGFASWTWRDPSFVLRRLIGPPRVGYAQPTP